MLSLHQRYKLNYIYANKITRDLFGLNEQGVAGKTDYDFFKVKTVEQLRKIDNVVLAGKSSKEEITTHDKCNNTKHFIEVKTPIYENEQVIGLLGISTDITEQKELENKVTYLSLTDTLPLLPSKRHLNEHFKQFRSHKEKPKYSELLFIDLDNFKPINDTYGHDIGNKTLKIIARRLQSDLRQIDFVARLGGDEFVVLHEFLNEDQLAAEKYTKEVIERIKII